MLQHTDSLRAKLYLNLHILTFTSLSALSTVRKEREQTATPGDLLSRFLTCAEKILARIRFAWP